METRHADDDAMHHRSDILRDETAFRRISLQR